MEQMNWWLMADLSQRRSEDMLRAAEHERFLKAHGLDLWSVLRHAIAARLPRRTVLVAEPATQHTEVLGVCVEEAGTRIAA